jgi:hypothetical protein
VRGVTTSVFQETCWVLCAGRLYTKIGQFGLVGPGDYWCGHSETWLPRGEET